MKGGRSALIGGAMLARLSSPSELLRGGKPPGPWNSGCKRGKPTAPDSTYKAFHPGRLGRGPTDLGRDRSRAGSGRHRGQSAGCGANAVALKPLA
jgi:hypothetical protein